MLMRTESSGSFSKNGYFPPPPTKNRMGFFPGVHIQSLAGLQEVKLTNHSLQRPIVISSKNEKYRV